MHDRHSPTGPTANAPRGAYLPPPAAEHLRAALEQMQHLRRTSHVDAGVCYLQAMLRHLEAVRKVV